MRTPAPLPLPFDPLRWADVLTAEHAIRTETASYTAQAHDFTIRCDATAGALTVTLLPAALLSGKVYVIRKVDASVNAVTIDADGSEEIDGVTTKSTTTRWAGWMIQSDGTSWNVIAT